MKKIFLALVLFSGLAFAEPSFQQIETLIGQQQYAAAEQGLELIIRNHPQSAKAFYAMAQAQAGLGNLGKARYALDKATGLDPALTFASADNIKSLRQAISPQVAKIEVVKEESHWFRNLLILLALGGIGYAIWRFILNKDNNAGLGNKDVTPGKPSPSSPAPSGPRHSSVVSAQTSSQSYTPPSTPAPIQTTAPSVVNNHYGSSNDGLLTGVVLGSMMNNHSHNTIIEREVVRDSSWDNIPRSAPAQRPDVSWDSKPTQSTDDSSWGSSGSSSSDSSWSSSSDSSSSSWDSDSSSGGSDW